MKKERTPTKIPTYFINVINGLCPYQSTIFHHSQFSKNK